MRWLTLQLSRGISAAETGVSVRVGKNVDWVWLQLSRGISAAETTTRLNNTCQISTLQLSRGISAVETPRDHLMGRRPTARFN